MALAAARSPAAAAPSSRSGCSSSSSTVGGYILVALAERARSCRPTSTRCSRGCSASTSSRTSRCAASRPRADATLLPLAALLNGIGFVTIARARPRLQARTSSRCGSRSASRVFVLTLFVVRDVRIFERYRYTALLLGHRASCCCRSRPASAARSTARRLWVAIGSLTFEPSEIAKVLLVAFFAAYLVDKRELLAQGRVRVGRWFLPSPRDLGPLLLAWGVALLVLVLREGHRHVAAVLRRVRGDALHRRRAAAAYVVGTLVLLVDRRVHRVQGVRARARARRELAQPVDGPRRATASRSSRAGTRSARAGSPAPGSGSAARSSFPNASTDFVFAAIGEELGLVGTIGVVAAFMLLVGSAYRIAVDAIRPFAKLFAAGIATILGLQTFLIIGGVHARHPAHRHHAAVRVVRRLVARRQLRAARDPAAHLRRHGANATAPSTARVRHEHRHPARRHRR